MKLPCQFDRTFWPVLCKLSIGAVLSDGLTGGKCTDDRIDPYKLLSFQEGRYDFVSAKYFKLLCCDNTVMPYRFVSISVLSSFSVLLQHFKSGTT